MGKFLRAIGPTVLFLAYIWGRSYWPESPLQDIAVGILLMYVVIHSRQLNQIEWRVRQMSRHLDEYEE